MINVDGVHIYSDTYKQSKEHTIARKTDFESLDISSWVINPLQSGTTKIDFPLQE